MRSIGRVLSVMSCSTNAGVGSSVVGSDTYTRSVCSTALQKKKKENEFSKINRYFFLNVS
jgi:hypothetical protein